MLSVKPGRGPSFMGIFAGIFAAIFGIFFASTAMSHGAPPIFGLFGAFFVLIGIGSAIASGVNAFGKNRFSQFDITTDDEESDPFVASLGTKLRSGSEISLSDVDGSESRSEKPEHGQGLRFEGNFCPYCGTKTGEDFNFCAKCGKDI